MFFFFKTHCTWPQNLDCGDFLVPLPTIVLGKGKRRMILKIKFDIERQSSQSQVSRPSSMSEFWKTTLHFVLEVDYLIKQIYAASRGPLRLLTECFILVGSAMFGAAFNMVTHVGLSFEKVLMPFWETFLCHTQSFDANVLIKRLLSVIVPKNITVQHV